MTHMWVDFDNLPSVCVLVDVWMWTPCLATGCFIVCVLALCLYLYRLFYLNAWAWLHAQQSKRVVFKQCEWVPGMFEEWMKTVCWKMQALLTAHIQDWVMLCLHNILDIKATPLLRCTGTLDTLAPGTPGLPVRIAIMHHTYLILHNQYAK